MEGGVTEQVKDVLFDWAKEYDSFEDVWNLLYLFKICEIGDEVIVCFNPAKNEKIAIIKRGKFALETVWTWLQWFIIAIGCFICMILAILVLLKVIG